MHTSRSSLLLSSIAVLLGFASAGAQAHTGYGLASGFASGFLHPIFGWDHMVVMVAVGMWGAFLRRPAIWVLPVVFPVVMTVGGTLGILGMALPFVEIGIALSVLVLGLMVVLAVRPPLFVAAIIVGIFAIFHAHATELPSTANPLSFALGFVLATGLLHLSGIGLGLLAKRRWASTPVHTSGGLIAAARTFFLFGAT